jgi:quercetin dioxygenase-like cupin family protein
MKELGAMDRELASLKMNDWSLNLEDVYYEENPEEALKEALDAIAKTGPGYYVNLVTPDKLGEPNQWLIPEITKRLQGSNEQVERIDYVDQCGCGGYVTRVYKAASPNGGKPPMDIKALKAFQEFNNERFTKRVVFQHGDHVIFILNFMPGQELPTHKHPGTDVYLLVLEGNGTMIADGASSEVTTGAIIHVSGDKDFAFKNTGNEKTSLYVFLNKIPDERYAKNV